MTDTSAQEPTMEEILASIRRIISEDDTPAVAAEPAPPPVAAAPEPEPAPPPPPPPPVVQPEPEDVLELTEPVAPPRPEPVRTPPPPPVLDDIEFAEPAPPPPRAPAFASYEPEEGLLSDRVAQTAAGHFGSLAHSVLMPAEGRTLEDVVKELLRPLLKEWLDTHLAAIVEAKVQSEVERISRRRV